MMNVSLNSPLSSKALMMRPMTMIDLRDEPVVHGASSVDSLIGNAVKCAPLRLALERYGAVRAIAPLANGRCRYRAILIHRIVRLRRVERGMRFGERAPKEERERGVAAHENVLHTPLGDPGGHGKALGHGSQGGIQFVLGHPVVHRLLRSLPE